MLKACSKEQVNLTHPVKLVKVIRLHYKATDNTSTRSSPHLNLYIAEEDVEI